MTRKRSSIVHQFLALFIILAIVPIVFLSTLFLNNLQEKYKERAINDMSITMTQYANYINFKLEQYQIATEELAYYNEEFRQMIMGDTEISSEKLFDVSGQYMRAFSFGGEIYKCAAYSENAETGSDYSLEKAFEKDWYFSIVQENNYSGWFCGKTEGLGEALISLVRPINDFSKNRYIDFVGLVKLDLYIEEVFGKNTPLYPGSDAEFSVVLPDNITIFKSEGFDLNNSEIFTMTLPNYNIKINYYMNDNFIQSGNAMDKVRFILLVLGVMIIVIVIFTVYARKLQKRINKLLSNMKKVEKMDFTIESDEKENDEIATLDKAFCQMANRLSVLVDENYKKEIQKKDAELRALHFQIKPHFLFNSLESISSVAQLEGSPKASAMCQMLGKMFRYSVYNSENGYVKLSQELQYVQNYIKMQNIRFDGRFILEQNVPEKHMEADVLKFSIQPFVENVIKHAFIEMKSNCVIRIFTDFKDSDLFVTICDNGSGMERDKLEELRKKIFGNKGSVLKNDKMFGLGIANVHLRLRYAYGDEYGITEIGNAQNGGFYVVLKFKM